MFWSEIPYLNWNGIFLIVFDILSMWVYIYGCFNKLNLMVFVVLLWYCEFIVKDDFICLHVNNL
jgi:hypothetical protein